MSTAGELDAVIVQPKPTLLSAVGLSAQLEYSVTE